MKYSCVLYYCEHHSSDRRMFPGFDLRIVYLHSVVCASSTGTWY